MDGDATVVGTIAPTADKTASALVPATLEGRVAMIESAFSDVLELVRTVKEDVAAVPSSQQHENLSALVDSLHTKIDGMFSLHDVVQQHAHHINALRSAIGSGSIASIIAPVVAVARDETHDNALVDRTFECATCGAQSVMRGLKNVTINGERPCSVCRGVMSIANIADVA
jgi:hypothetical protein